NRFLKFCQDSAAAQNARCEQRAQLTQQAWEQLEVALNQCLAGGGGFSFFGNRSKRLLRVFIDQLTAFTRQRLTEEVYCAGLQFFAILQGKLKERLQDLTFCRQRLRNLQEGFEAPADEAENYMTAGAGMENARFGLDSTPNLS